MELQTVTIAQRLARFYSLKETYVHRTCVGQPEHFRDKRQEQIPSQSTNFTTMSTREIWTLINRD